MVSKQSMCTKKLSHLVVCRCEGEAGVWCGLLTFYLSCDGLFVSSEFKCSDEGFTTY